MAQSLTFKQFTIALEEYEKTGSFPDNLTEEQIQQLDEFLKPLYNKIKEKITGKKQMSNAEVGARENVAKRDEKAQQAKKRQQELDADKAERAQLEAERERLLKQIKQLNMRDPQHVNALLKRLRTQIELINARLENSGVRSSIQPSNTARNAQALDRTADRTASISWRGKPQPEIRLN